jgi:tRNA-specific 2-thiouridylase|nr:MAG: tRNA-specific 2-thiouridylase MnmA [Bacteroidota bacterium]
MSRMGRVLVAMSGGVDSSTAAALLRDQGYEVIGVTMKTWDYATGGLSAGGRSAGCCSLDDIQDARRVAVRLGFPHYILDIREEFGDWVIERFVSEYLAGRTPNPCILCNTHIKWAALLRRADMLDCQYIATGHYARIRREGDRYVLYRGRDLNKDQSYVLWGLSQEQLARTLFPLGSYTKPEVRELAAQYGLEHVAGKRDSYEICFIPDNDYRRFLRTRVPELSQRLRGGTLRLRDGTVLGEHEGYPFYTIGQRRGLKLARGRPLYVTRIDPETNTVYVGEAEELLQRALLAMGANAVKYPPFTEPRRGWARIRYRDEGAPCVAHWQGDRLYVRFDEPRRAITPGQAVVFYEGEDVVAGAWIERLLEEP